MKEEKKENKYWLSLEQWQNDKSFQEQAQKEFMQPASTPEGLDRREFLKLMGASLALSSLSCVRRPTEQLVPYVKRPREVIPGIPNYYASSFYDGGEGFGLIVQTREGRPIKVEGNPKHPSNTGGMSARAHSHLLSLYDPERLKEPKRHLFNKTKSNKERIRAFYDEMDPLIVEELKKGGVALLTDHYPSPASFQLIQDFKSAYGAHHFVWDPNGLEVLASAKQKCFGGQASIPKYHLDRAEMILSINCDFLGTFLSPTQFNKQFSRSRKPNKKMNRLVVFESPLSLTGTNADERYRISPSENVQILLILIDEVLKVTSGFSYTRRSLRYLRTSKPLSVSEEKIRMQARRLLKLKGRGLVLSGGFAGQSKDEESLHILTFFLNSLLNNVGSTLEVDLPRSIFTYKHPPISSLIRRLERGHIRTLIIHRTNPLYSYPQTQELLQAMKKAELVIYTGSHMDETAHHSHYVIPDLHDLEKWSDWEFEAGLVSLQQPTVRPLIKSRTFEDVW